MAVLIKDGFIAYFNKLICPVFCNVELVMFFSMIANRLSPFMQICCKTFKASFACRNGLHECLDDEDHYNY